MTQNEIELLLRYYNAKSDRLHLDILDYADRYRLRDCDQIDHLESIIAITRYETFNEVFHEILRLLKDCN